MNEFLSILNKFKKECKSQYVLGELIKSELYIFSEKGKLKLNDKLKLFYSEYNPKELYIPWTVEEITLYSIDELYESQYGYRWLPDSNVNIEGWQESWIVIGDILSDPIIADVSSIDTPIYLAVHGIGSWELKQVSEKFEDFISFLTLWISQVLNKFNGNLMNDDSIIPTKILKVIRKIVRKSIDEKYRSNLLEFIET